jgi:hypothetical protein
VQDSLDYLNFLFIFQKKKAVNRVVGGGARFTAVSSRRRSTVDWGHKVAAQLTGDKRMAATEGGGSPRLHREVEQSMRVLTNGRTQCCGGCADLVVKRTN